MKAHRKPLTDAERAELLADLDALEQALRSMLHVSQAATRPVDLDQPIGRISRIDAIQQQKMVSAGHQANKIRLSQIGAARNRIEEELYGDCISCEEPIGFRRLKVAPEAPLCVVCQGARERR